MNAFVPGTASLQQREQRVVAVGAVVLGLIILVGGILMPLQSAVSKAIEGSETRREDLAWMRLHAPEIAGHVNLVSAPTGEAPVASSIGLRENQVCRVRCAARNPARPAGFGCSWKRGISTP